MSEARFSCAPHMLMSVNNLSRLYSLIESKTNVTGAETHIDKAPESSKSTSICPPIDRAPSPAVACPEADFKTLSLRPPQSWAKVRDRLRNASLTNRTISQVSNFDLYMDLNMLMDSLNVYNRLWRLQQVLAHSS